MRSIEDLSQLSREGDRLLLLVTDNCRFCETTKAAIAEMADELSHLDPVMLHGMDDPEACTLLRARTFPRVGLFRDGDLVASRESADATTLRSWLSESGADGF